MPAGASAAAPFSNSERCRERCMTENLICASCWLSSQVMPAEVRGFFFASITLNNIFMIVSSK
jgi:hypothetical protein